MKSDRRHLGWAGEWLADVRGQTMLRRLRLSGDHSLRLNSHDAQRPHTADVHFLQLTICGTI